MDRPVSEPSEKPVFTLEVANDIEGSVLPFDCPSGAIEIRGKGAKEDEGRTVGVMTLVKLRCVDTLIVWSVGISGRAAAFAAVARHVLASSTSQSIANFILMECDKYD